MNKMNRARTATLGLLVFAFSARLFAGDNYAVVIAGASGGEPYAAKYTAWRQSFVSTLRTTFGYPEDHISVLAENAGAAGVRTATRDEVQRILIDLRSRLTKDDTLVVLLIGHGTAAEGSRGEDAKFNLVGPDLKASEFAELLKPVASRVIFVNATSTSFPFLRHLAGPGRIVITATDSTAQEFETVFGEFFVRAFQDQSADADKNGRVSVFEAFSYASAAVRVWFDQHGQLPTERPLLDDDGDGVGREASNPGSDGELARRTFLQPAAPPANAAAAALVKRQGEIESQIDELKKRRSTIPPDAYSAELERLLTELARVSTQIRPRP